MCKKLVLLILVIGLTAPIIYGDYVCGDANADTKVNVSDAVYIINFVFAGGTAPDPLEVADGNCDTKVNVSDAVWIINFVFVGGNAPCDTDGDGVLDCTPDCPATVTDSDGNVYNTILIGDQCWMTENLKATHYRNGDSIPNVISDSAWFNIPAGSVAYCNYDNDENNADIYGRLYNWWAIYDSRNIAPEGWIVASASDYGILIDYLGGEAIAGGKLKEAGTLHWNEPNSDATNESGFTALPGGNRSAVTGEFKGVGIKAFFWSTSDLGPGLYAYFFRLNYDSPFIDMLYWVPYRNGMAVRCLKQ